ncbi:hypothetical protein [Candidatus Pelagadaptatus aseana]|uniref:hypothetical protein n=1 Tax=Candidatus Pelagadaptatus aseana TaxID=3120508 RepID=UPI003C6FC6B2
MLPFPLYHGTSTLFLRSIIESGLAGVNPVKDQGILPFAKELLPIVKKTLGEEESFMVKVDGYERIVNQVKTEGGFNFQHGDTYVSPSIATASRYACNSRFGSEIFSYSIEFLEELVRRNIPGVTDDLYTRYRDIFSMLYIYPAPILIRVNKISESNLLDEHGNCPKNQILDLKKYKEMKDIPLNVIGQQMNFRIKNSIKADDLDVFLLCVTKYNQIDPDFNAYPIDKNNINLYESHV